MVTKHEEKPVSRRGEARDTCTKTDEIRAATWTSCPTADVEMKLPAPRGGDPSVVGRVVDCGLLKLLLVRDHSFDPTDRLIDVSHALGESSDVYVLEVGC